MDYIKEKLLSKAIWLLNAVDISFDQAQKLEERSFGKSVKSIDDMEMIRVFLSGGLKKDIKKFIEDYEIMKKKNIDKV